jgi:hypothetical protein
MSTSIAELSLWFDRGIAEGATHMVVVCDTFDHEDYPVYCNSEKEAREKYANPGNMQRVMEVYHLSSDKASQMIGGTRVLNFGPSPSTLTGPPIPSSVSETAPSQPSAEQPSPPSSQHARRVSVPTDGSTPS